MAGPGAHVEGLGSTAVPSYGSIPPAHRVSTQTARVGRAHMAWLAGAAACATVFAVTLIAVASSRNEGAASVLVGTKMAEKSQLESVTVYPPTEEDFASFQAGAQKVLEHVGVDPAKIDKTDLKEACGDFMLPCVASVGECLMTESAEVNGREEVTNEACQCYVKGNSIPIQVPDRPEVDAQCSYVCLSAIKGMFQQHLYEHNGDLATSLACPRTFENLAHEVYANEFKYDVKPSEEDADGLKVESVVDEHVLHAANAVLMHINLIRGQDCPAIPQIDGGPTVTYARRGEVEAGLGQYLVEFNTADGQEFVSRVVHLPKYKQLVDPAMESEDPENLLGSFEVMRLNPDPCATGAAAELVQTKARVDAINQQNLHWKAEYNPEFEGVTMDKFGMGLEWPSEHEIQANTVWLADDSEADIPESYDARDHVADAAQCTAFNVLNQGGCGSCYAFAAASALSARFCRDSDKKWDVVLSPQEMMDCTRGCAGGWPLTVYKTISSGGGYTVESWCDPYKKKKQVCGDTCDEGQKFRGLKGTAVIVSGKGAKGVSNMQKHLMEHGPGVVAVTIYKDFHSYKKGVYHMTEGSKKVGGHAVSLIGWGTEDGVDYWLVQNSWGHRAGDKGFWKIRRGTNECGIEKTGLMVVKPEMPLDCTDVGCLNGGTPDRHCVCQCPAPWEGAKCETCALQCHNGGETIEGVESLACSKCFCPAGTFGGDCGTKVAISPDSGSDETTFTLDASFLTEKPTMGSFVALYRTDATDTEDHMPDTRVYLCGETYDAGTNAGLCPESVQVALPNPGRDGKMVKTYKVVLVHYSPPNEFGLEGYPAEIAEDDTIGELTVMKNIGGKRASPVQVLASVRGQSVQQQKLRAIEEHKAAQKAMDQRLDEMDDIAAYLIAHGGHYGEVFPPAGTGEDAKPTDAPEQEEATAKESKPAGPELLGSLTVSGSIGEHPVVWTSGAPSTFCYKVPAEFNQNPKNLYIYVGDGADGLYFPTGLLGGGHDVDLPTSEQGCKSFSVSPGIPAGTIYTMKMQHESEVLAAAAVLLAHASVAIESYSLGFEANGQKFLTLPVKWSVTTEAVSVTDVIKIVDAQGDVVDWFFTSCSCKGPHGTEPVADGQAEFTLYAPVDKTPGAYHVHFHPEGAEFVGAVAEDWIPWSTAWESS